MKKIVSSVVLTSLLFTSGFAGDILAVVNNENITSDVAPKNFDTLSKNEQKQIINKLVEKRLASNYALDTDIVKDEKYKKVLKHILSNAKDKSKATKTNTLADIVNKKSIKGFNEEQLKSKKGLLAFDFLLEKKASNLKPSKDELKKYYKLQKYKYDTPAQIELLSIVVKEEKLAKKIIEDIKEAEDSLQEFSNQAKKHSLAPNAKNHGYLGKMPVVNLNEQLKPILKDKKRAYFSKTPVKTQFGYEIFYVLNDIPKYNSNYEEVKDEVKQEYIQKSVKNWAIHKIKELKQKANIKIMQ